MGKSFNRTELAQIRKSAPANTKLTVSRGARNKARHSDFDGYSQKKIYRMVRFALQGTEFSTPEMAEYVTRKLDKLQPDEIPTPNGIRYMVLRGQL
jgi:hypothetical protein